MRRTTPHFNTDAFLLLFLMLSWASVDKNYLFVTSKQRREPSLCACPSVAQGVRRNCSNFARLISLWSRLGIKDYGGKWKEHLLPMSNTSHVGLGKAASHVTASLWEIAFNNSLLIQLRPTVTTTKCTSVSESTNSTSWTIASARSETIHLLATNCLPPSPWWTGKRRLRW